MSIRWTRVILIGVVAMAIYLGMVFAQPGGYAIAVNTYGAPLFWCGQALRTAGCAASARATEDGPRRV